MSPTTRNGKGGRSAQIRATMAAAAALFLGIFTLMGVQMALGEDPAVGTRPEATEPRNGQSAQRSSEPPATQWQEPQRYYEQPYQERGYQEPGYYDEAPPAYQQEEQSQPQPDTGQFPQQGPPPVQSGPS